jgi:hypothetical protein
MAKYLAQHPQIFFSIPKEPFHHCVDFPGLVAKHGYGDERRYKSLFDGAESKHSIVMEGSTAYLQSQVAIERIERCTKGTARYIVMLRDPVDLVVSFHRTQLIAFNETERDLAVAWGLQDQRLNKTVPIPDTCINPSFLQYREVAALGTQVSRLVGLVDPSRVHFIFFDDFAADPRASYDSLIQWLRLEPDPHMQVSHENPGSKLHRIPALSRLLQRPPAILLPVLRTLRNQLRQPRLRRANRILSRLVWSRSRPASVPTESVISTLRAALQPEVRLLERVTGRNLRGWLPLESRT